MGRFQHCGTRAAGLAAALSMSLLMPIAGHAGEAGTPARSPEAEGLSPAINNTSDAAEAEGDRPPRRLVHWNEYEGPDFGLRLGAFLLYDYADYAQDDDSKG